MASLPRDLSHLPTELLSHCFNFLSSTDLDVAKQVCTLWRVVALDHPTFWGTIVVDSIKPGALALAHSRVTAGRGRSCSITVNIRSTGNPRVVWLLYLIEHALPCVRELAIGVDVAYLPGLLDILATPAPLLEYFELKAYGRGLPFIFSPPHSLFGGSTATRLRKVVFLNMFFPTFPVSAFQAVTDISFEYRVSGWSSTREWINDKTIHFPSQLFLSCPDLCRLSICGATATISVANVPPDQLCRISGLSLLSLHAATDCYDHIVSLPSCEEIIEISFSPAEQYTIEQAAEHLSGDLHVQIRTPLSDHATKVALEIVMRQTDRGLPRRSFLIPFTDRSDSSDDPDTMPLLSTLFSSTFIVHRLVSLEVSSNAWGEVLSAVPQDNAISTLTVFRNTVRDPDHKAQGPLFPRLSTLAILRSNGSRPVLHSSAFLRFLSLISWGKVHLQLHGVMLESCGSDLHSRLLSVKLVQ